MDVRRLKQRWGQHYVVVRSFQALLECVCEIVAKVSFSLLGEEVIEKLEIVADKFADFFGTQNRVTKTATRALFAKASCVQILAGKVFAVVRKVALLSPVTVPSQKVFAKTPRYRGAFNFMALSLGGKKLVSL